MLKEEVEMINRYKNGKLFFTTPSPGSRRKVTGWNERSVTFEGLVHPIGKEALDSLNSTRDYLIPLAENIERLRDEGYDVDFIPVDIMLDILDFRNVADAAPGAMSATGWYYLTAGVYLPVEIG